MLDSLGRPLPSGISEAELEVELVPVEPWERPPLTGGRRCLRCINKGWSPPGIARFTHLHGSLCQWCLEIDNKMLIQEFWPKLEMLQDIEDEIG